VVDPDAVERRLAAILSADVVGYGAHLYAGIGDVDRMYACLDGALEQRSSDLRLWLKVCPSWAPYRDDRRFIALLRQLAPER
jgi:hypothetical protein